MNPNDKTFPAFISLILLQLLSQI